MLAPFARQYILFTINDISSLSQCSLSGFVVLDRLSVVWLNVSIKISVILSHIFYFISFLWFLHSSFFVHLKNVHNHKIINVSNRLRLKRLDSSYSCIRNIKTSNHLSINASTHTHEYNTNTHWHITNFCQENILNFFFSRITSESREKRKKRTHQPSKRHIQ